METLSPEVLRQPRIVLVAGSFPPVVTATAVWLREMGLDLTLVKFQAYRTATETVTTVSQLLPVPSVEDFAVIPRVAAVSASSAFPQVDWSGADLQTFASVVTNPSVQAAMDLCAEHPGSPVAFATIVEHTGRGQFVVRADMAGLTQLVKKRFGRSNWPLDVHYDPQLGTARYSLTAARAAAWTAARHPQDGAVNGAEAPMEGDVVPVAE